MWLFGGFFKGHPWREDGTWHFRTAEHAAQVPPELRRDFLAWFETLYPELRELTTGLKASAAFPAGENGEHHGLSAFWYNTTK